MGRDRDPFDRTMEALRRRLETRAPPQGAPLSINVLAAELGVSPTPVREVLAHLAGEGLVTRTPGGYAGIVHDAASLADLYRLARILALGLAADGARGVRPSDPGPAELDPFTDLIAAASNRALAETFIRVRARLAPFARAEAWTLSDAPAELARLKASVAAGGADLPRLIGRFHDRRAKASGRILMAALGLLGGF